ncbi:MAG: diadenylate cyclase CdaA [Eubacterium sp.]|nr:diadenylate cyclase CdaA [Eubacterium sp.]
MGSIGTFFRTYFDWFYVPHLTWTDVLDIIIIAYLLYHILLWFKTSRAWTLLKGILVLLLFLGIAALLRLNTILWLAKNIASVLIIALIILFQPELRRALDELGRKKLFNRFFNFDDRDETESRFSDKTVYELVRTAAELSKAKTGALIVIEHDTPLGEYERTGISLDAVVSTQLLVNIFERNTPLHDGAVIVRDNRVVAATCYLPLTERRDVNKELGTRHRAGLGLSENTDSMTIIVSEETGAVSVAYRGQLVRNLNDDSLRKQLELLQDKQIEQRRRRWKKGGQNDETENRKNSV